MGTTEPTIGYVCTRTTHLVENGAVDHLTIHDRQWAYCHGDVRESEHDWQPTGGTTLTELKSLARAARQNGNNRHEVAG